MKINEMSKQQDELQKQLQDLDDADPDDKTESSEKRGDHFQP